jgi:hypothetical protein
MAEHVWSVLCYKGCIDKFTDQISLLDVVELLPVSFERSPMELRESGLDVQLQLVSLWTRSKPESPEVAHTRVSLLTPDRSIEGQDEQVVDLQRCSRIRTFFKMTALPFRDFGVYVFVVEQSDGTRDRWREVARIPLEIGSQPESAALVPES